MGRYYQSEDYVSHSGNPRGLWGRAYQWARMLSIRSKRRFVEAKTGIQKGAILDYGCGVGFFLEEMSRKGWTVQGVEPAEQARDVAQQRIPGRIISPEEFEGDNTTNLDVVTLWHVLEHLYNPAKVLTALRDRLTAGGWLIVAVPNAASWEATVYGPDWAAYDVPRHVFHFSPDRLHDLVTSTGFNFRTIKTLPLDPFYISLLSERQMGDRGNLIRGGIRGSRSFLKGVLNPGNGSSIVLVAQKA